MYCTLRLAAQREVPREEGGDTSQETSIYAITNASSPLYYIIQHHNRGPYWTTLGPPIA